MKTERPSEIQTAFDIEFCWYMTQAALAVTVGTFAVLAENTTPYYWGTYKYTL